MNNKKNTKISNGVKYPNFREEKKLWRKGCRIVVGVDESGRGPLCGPVIAAAVVFKIPNFQFLISNKISNIKFQMPNVFKGIRDSKKLTPKKREEFYKILTNHPRIKWGIGRVSEKVIDRINILEATKLAMERAVKNLEKKHSPADFLILDGNFKINSRIAQKSIIKADEKVFSCAAASIIAKATRDNIMIRCHRKYPQYGFDRHKGYPTRHHQTALRRYGPCRLHRISFKPIVNLAK